MKITAAEDIGRLVREKRKADGLTLEEAAAICGVSYAFLFALEHGKASVRLDKLLLVTSRLGIELEAQVRSWAAPGDSA